MSDDFYSTSSQGWKGDQENISTLRETNDFKHNSHTLKSIASVSQASVSSGSTSDRNTEHGFNCDSPEGGTIKKKPSHQVPSALKTTSNSSKLPSNMNGNIIYFLCRLLPEILNKRILQVLTTNVFVYFRS